MNVWRILYLWGLLNFGGVCETLMNFWILKSFECFEELWNFWQKFYLTSFLKWLSLSFLGCLVVFVKVEVIFSFLCWFKLSLVLSMLRSSSFFMLAQVVYSFVKCHYVSMVCVSMQMSPVYHCYYPCGVTLGSDLALDLP